MMKKRVSRVEAIIIMKAAREFRANQLKYAQISERPKQVPSAEPTVPEVFDEISPVQPTKASFITIILSLFKSKKRR